MADQSPQELESALDQYLTDNESAGIEEFVLHQARRAPWWTISLLIHVILIAILWRWPMGTRVEAKTPDITMVVDLREYWDEHIEWPDETQRKIELPPEPKDEDPPLAESVTPRGLDPEMPPEPDMSKLLSEPAALTTMEPPDPVQPLTHRTPVLIVDDKGPGKHTGNIFGPRRLPPGPPGSGGSSVGGPGAIKRALYWLARAQERDGSWDAKRWDGAQPYRVGSTGMALLAYLGAGYTHRNGPFKATVRRALGWLHSSQRPDGSFPWTTFYEQGIAAMAVCEAYALTHDPQVGRLAQRAVDYIVRLQPEHGGFRYQGAVAKGEGDLSVTGWQIMALKSAMATKLRVPDRAVERSHRFLANSGRKYGSSAYLVGNPAAGSPAMASVGMVCRIFLDSERYDGEIMAAARHLLNGEVKDLRAVPGGTSKQLVRDLYYTYYSSLAMYQVGGEYWRVWRRMFLRPLITEQVGQRFDTRGRYVRGSWDPTRHRWGKAGGRVYATAMAALSLEVEIRYLRIYRR